MNLSAPGPPFRISFPVSPNSVSSPSSPDKISSSSAPIRISLLPPPSILSFPKLPFSKSSPPLPNIISSLAPPITISSPPSPYALSSSAKSNIVSLLSVPTHRSGPSVPTIMRPFTLLSSIAQLRNNSSCLPLLFPLSSLSSSPSANTLVIIFLSLLLLPIISSVIVDGTVVSNKRNIEGIISILSVIFTISRILQQDI